MDVAEAHLNKLAKDKTFVRNFKAKLRYVQRDYKTPCLEWQGGTDKAGYGHAFQGSGSYGERRNYDP